MPKTLMERFTLTYIKIKFQNTKSQKLPEKKKWLFKNQNLKIFYIGLYKWEGQLLEMIFLISLLIINKNKIYINEKNFLKLQ